MSISDKLPRGVRRLFSLPSSQERMLAEHDEEVRVHLAMRVAELEAHGFTRQAAEAEAQRRFGDADSLRRELAATARRQARAAGFAEWFRSMGQDIRFASRRLLASPLFVLATTTTLAVAIGATASLFGIVDQVLLKPYPYRDPDRVLAIQLSQLKGVMGTTMSPADFLDYRAQNTVFSVLATLSPREVTLRGTQEPERVSAPEVTPNYATTVGITPVLGRFLAADSGGPAEVVIGYALWQRRFGGARSVLGKVLRLDSLPYTIVGVMPPGLPTSVMYDGDLWTRLSFAGAAQMRRGDRHLAVFGRLEPRVSLERAQRDLNRIARQLAIAYPATDSGWTATATPLLQPVLGTITPTLTALLGAAVCVLLIGAANLANLFLVRYLAREREIALRTAIGATRGRIVRELAIESVLLGLIAAGLGIVLSVAGIRALRALAPASLPRAGQATVDGGVVAFGVLAAIVTVVLFGVLPAWRASRGDIADIVKEGGRTAAAPRRYRLQNALVMLQMAVALVLVTGAGLFLDSFERFRHMDPGFQPDGVLTAQIAPPSERYSTPERQAGFVSDVLEHLAAVPGVRSASISSNVPAAFVWLAGFTVVGDPAPDPAHRPEADLECVTSDYLRTMRLPLRRGRGVLPTDDRRAREIVVIDELLARKYFPGRDPIGQRLDFGNDTVPIVGVVGPVRQRGLAADDTPVMYAPYAQCPTPFAFVEARTAGDPEALTPSLRQAIFAVDPTVPVYDIETMAARMTESTGTTRFSTLLALVFAAVAFALSVVGLYSVLAYVVTQRRRELGVRLALGASNRHLMSEVLRQAAALMVGGIAGGSLAAWLLTRLLAGIFVGVSPHDPVVFTAAVVVFAAVALVATSVPAWRTTRIDPAVVLTSS